MAAHKRARLARGREDRSNSLIVCGIIEILIGVCSALLLPLMFLGMRFSAAALPASSQPMSSPTMFPSTWNSVAVAVFFIWMGIGTLKGRRWARAIMLVSSWLWLIVGLRGMVFWLMMAPSLFQATSPGASPMAEAVNSSLRVFMTVVLAVIYLLLPGIFVLFYSGKDVKATFEFTDPQPRWTDRCPLPVLAVSLALGYYAMHGLVALLDHTATPVVDGDGTIRVLVTLPIFGQVLTGVPAAAAHLVLAVVLAFLAREVYRLRMSGWWGVVALGGLVALSNILTFSTISMLDYSAKAGFSSQQLETLKSMHVLESFNSPLWTVLEAVAGLGYLIHVRKYFAAGSGDERDVQSCELSSS